MIMAVAVLGGCSTAPETESVGVPDNVSTPLPTRLPPSVRTIDPPASSVSCTNRIDYTADTRSNAEINSEGERTGSCPLPRK